MKMKKMIAIILAGVGILSVGAAETRADPLLVTQGFFQTFQFFNQGTFSGDNFAVSDINTAGGNFSAFPGQVFDTGIIVAGFGHVSGAPPSAFVPAGTGTIQVGNVSCQMIPIFDPTVPDCGGVMTFINSPIPIPPNLQPGDPFTAEAPFTMTGQLVLQDLVVDIQGSGILHALTNDGIMNSARYEFAVPEPSSAVLLFTGVSALLVARRRRRSAGLCDRA
jgi:hypothetical protein